MKIIEARDLSKRFGKIHALDKLSCDISAASIYGLIGSNGAGKSTFMRLVAGIYKADSGSLQYQGQEIFGNAALRHEILLVPDQPCFLPGENLTGMAHFYSTLYDHWDASFFNELLEVFPLDPQLALSKMSKGMQRQASVLLALAARPQLLLMDEAFDGLDPVMRESLKRILAREVVENQLTCIIASHNLRELEDFCDKIGLLHHGGLIYQHELESMNLGVYKIQTAFHTLPSKEELEALGLSILHCERRGSILQLVIRAEKSEIREKLAPLSPLILDMLPLTLEELFIYELEVKGYAVRNLI